MMIKTASQWQSKAGGGGAVVQALEAGNVVERMKALESGRTLSTSSPATLSSDSFCVCIWEGEGSP